MSGEGSPVVPRVAVVGAGIAGAGAAHQLRARRPDLEVVVIEAAPKVGGKLAVAEVGGVLTDVGAEALLARRPEATDLIRDAGLSADLVHPRTLAARLWNRGALVPLPRSLMGVPRAVEDLATVLSDDGLAEAARDPAVAALEEGEDVSVGDLVAHHLGEEVVQRMVEPMLGGVYAGHAHALSARAAIPGLVAALDGRRSLTEAAAAAMSPPPAPGEDAPPVFAGLVGGVGRLPAAVLADSGAEVRTGVTVRGLTRTGTGWRLETGSARAPETLDADAVVLAVPAAPTARLLEQVAPDASAALAAVDYASMAVITLAFRAEELPPSLADGSGFLTPPVDGHPVKGATWSFAKWQWVADAGDAAGGVRVLRCSVGRHREEHQLQRPDEELVALALADLRSATGIAGLPIDTHVQRWGGGLPQYAVGHVARVARIRSAVAALPGLAVCGAAYDGVGVPAVLGSAYAAVDVVLDHLDLTRPGRR